MGNIATHGRTLSIRAVALRAIERVKFILDDKCHFTRQARESAKDKRESAAVRQRKSEIGLA